MNSRVKILLGFCFSISALWVVYMLILQLFDPFNLNEIKKRRYNPYKELIIAQRGNIYDVNGHKLVSSLSYYQIDIDLRRVSSIAQRQERSQSFYYNMISDIVAKHTGMNRDSIFRKMANAKGPTVVLSENVDENQLRNIRTDFAEHNLNILVSTFSSVKRIYSNGKLASRLLGVANGVTDNSTRFSRFTHRLEGLNGIEKAYDSDLLGSYGWRETMYDGRQRKVSNPNVASKPVSNGSSIYLTINANIQEILENNLQKGLNQYKAKNAIGVIMNPKNGNIVAMAGLNELDRRMNDNQVRSLQNMPIQFLFEPGSTIKPFVSLTAIEKNLYKETDIFDCSPMRLQYNNTRRVISDSHELGRISFRDVIVHSSNVGVARIAEKIGSRELYRTYLNFGFGTSTTVDLDMESSGIFKKLNDWSNYTLHSISFGQEMSVTALQLANAYCALANGGYLLKPNIISKKVDDKGKVYFQSGRKVIRSISNKKSHELNNSFMLDVVERGTGANTRFQNIKIAGKTGTSEKAVAGGYSKRNYTASFAGFFPYENPEYVMVIVYDEPEYRFRFGSQSAAMTFRHVVEEMLTLPECNIIPAMKMHAQELITMPNLIGLKIDEAKKVLTNNKIDFHVYNETKDSYIVKQFPQPGIKFGSKNKISLYANKNKDFEENQIQIDEEVMPNLVGLSLRQAIQVSKMLKINLRVEGSGHVVSQTIKPGEKIKLEQNILVVAR